MTDVAYIVIMRWSGCLSNTRFSCLLSKFSLFSSPVHAFFHDFLCLL